MSALQRTPEWFKARCGSLTASRAATAFARGKNGQKLKAYYGLIDDIVAERVTGETVSHFTSDAMRWGIENEDDARFAYALEKGVVVDEVGFIPHPEIEHLGASPDGLVGNDGLVEIKCPETVTHLSYIRAKQVPEAYKPQMLVQLLCTGRKWCDFVSYDPRLKGAYARLSQFCIRFTPTKEELDEAERLAKEFLKDVDDALKELEV